MPLPTSPFDTAKSIYAGLSIISLKIPAGGSAVIYEARKLDQPTEQSEKSIEMPDATGVLRRVRTVLTNQQESFMFELVEPKRLLTIFGNSLSGRKTGTCIIYIPDPNDAAGKVALTSETDIPVTVTRDGGLTFGDADFTKATIKIESNKLGAITWTADASVPA